MKIPEKGNERCANPECGRIAALPGGRCETCELEWILYRRDLRPGTEKRSPVESR